MCSHACLHILTGSTVAMYVHIYSQSLKDSIYTTAKQKYYLIYTYNYVMYVRYKECEKCIKFPCILATVYVKFLRDINFAVFMGNLSSTKLNPPNFIKQL